MKKQDLLLYAITDRSWLKPGETLSEQVEKAILGKATIIQLREKYLTGDELEQLALEVFSVCKKYNIPFIINDDVATVGETRTPLEPAAGVWKTTWDTALPMLFSNRMYSPLRGRMVKLVSPAIAATASAYRPAALTTTRVS